MRKTSIAITAASAALLLLGACSQKTDDKVDAAATSAENDAKAVASDAGNHLDNMGAAASDAASDIRSEVDKHTGDGKAN